MSAEKKRKGSEAPTEEGLSPGPESFRAVTYVRMQLADLEFLATRKLMTDPRTFEQVKKILQQATTQVRGVKTMGMRGCNGDPCEPDEHCMRGRCVFGPPRGEE